MANMARNGSAGTALSGFSVFQSALGAALQWLPAVGTPELDDLVNSFLPGPASIQDKRAHIAMDFFEYSRQTGESLKFYAVAPASPFTPVTTASPAASAYGSSFNASPVLSNPSSWAHSPASFSPVATADDFVAAASKTKSASKKASASASRQQPVDFSNHPGMRIMTKDGRDVTNSASRGCKSKEQRDHAHLMRIIKACDSCKRKKTRCDPSHRKRTSSQTSAAPADKLAKKVKKVEQLASAPLPVQATDFIVSNTFETAENTISFPALDTTQFSDEEFQSIFNEIVNDQELLSTNDLFDNTFDSFSISNTFYNTPSISSSATSPSQVFDTPFTPALTDSSTFFPIDGLSTTTAAGDLSLQNPTLPYLTPGADLGTNYIDFNLYSPASSFYDEDPVFSQQDVASRRYSSQVDASTGQSSSSQQYVHLGLVNSPVTVSPVLPTPDPDHSDYYYEAERRSELVQHVPREQQPVLSSTAVASAVQSPASQFSSVVQDDHVSTAAASSLQSSVSPSTSSGTRRVIESELGGSSSQLQLQSRSMLTPPTTATSTVVQSGVLGSPVIASPLSTIIGGARGVSQSTTETAAGREDQQIVLQPCIGGLNAVVAMMMVASLPTRRLFAGGEAKNRGSLLFSSLSQLVVLGLVSILCGPGSQVPLASQINLLNMLGITIISLGFIALWCCGVPGTTSVSSKRLQIPMAPQGVIGNVKAKIQAIDQSSASFRSRASRREASVLRSFGTAALLRF